MSDDVAQRSAAQTNMLPKWDLVRALMGGTTAMRLAEKRYLPKEEGESEGAYSIRLKRSTLFNAFRKTVKDMTGKVFNREVVLGDDVPAQIKAWCENIDLAGRHLNVFARDVFMDGMQTGINYLLVDMQTAVQRPDGSPATLADEQKAGLRPYIKHLKSEELLGWKSELIGGVETLTQVRIKECVSEAVGEFSEKDIDQVRVLEPKKWRTFRQSTTADGTAGRWVLHEAGTTSLDKITLVPVYINRTGFMTGEPPLEDLADLNVAHWQSGSDQRHILHIARVPILFYAGAGDEATLVIGAGSAVKNNRPDAKLTYVEHTGQAIGAGDKDLENIQFQMQTQGLQLLIPNPGQTATGEVRDDAKENSPLAMMATALGDALEAAFAFAAEYAGLGTDGGSVTVNTDFGLSLVGRNDLATLSADVSAGHLSKNTYWTILQGLGIMPGTFDPKTEQDQIDAEPPPLGGPNARPMDLSGGGNNGPAA